MDYLTKDYGEGMGDRQTVTRVILYLLFLYTLALTSMLMAYEAEAVIGEAVDNTALAWNTGGTETWRPESWISRYGGDAAWIGELSGRGVSWIETKVEGRGTLSFHWKVSGAGLGIGALHFYIDGELAEEGRITGTTAWQERTYELAGAPETVHTLRWVYIRKNNGPWYGDNGYLDLVRWTPDRQRAGEAQFVATK